MSGLLACVAAAGNHARLCEEDGRCFQKKFKKKMTDVSKIKKIQEEHDRCFKNKKNSKRRW